MNRLCDVIILGSALLTTTYAYKEFRGLIPNGDNIPHPCGEDQVWDGIGHFKPAGGGPNNRFGLDFKKYSLKWSRELCSTDSDGDGRTNGEEMGDPGCRWSQGSAPERSTNLSHPGICEPLDSEVCRKKNLQFGDALDCNTPVKTCAAMGEAGMQKMDISFPPTSIPASVTNYFCLTFDLPVDGDYHLVATDPIIDNTDIIHHMLLFGCDEPPNLHGKYAALEAQHKEVPYRCGMVANSRCRQIIGTWTIGSHGDCFSREAGVRIGRHGYKTAALQVHWNNPLKLANLTDSSGMTIYYTANRRYHDAEFLMVGQEYLRIPAHVPSVTFDSTCPSACTAEMFQENIYVTRALNHMHYLGTSQSVSLYRDGEKVLDFTNDKNYQYDNPKFYNYDTPIEVRPGDEIRTKCTYSSDRNETVYYGAGTDDEMCFGFLTYYPTHNLTLNLCASWKTVQRCQRYIPKFKGVIDNCDYWTFVNATNADTVNIVTSVNKECANFEAENPDSCSTGCGREVSKALKHECLQNDIGGFIMHRMSRGKFEKKSPGGKAALSSYFQIAAYNLRFYNQVCGTVINAGTANTYTMYMLLLMMVSPIVQAFIYLQ